MSDDIEDRLLTIVSALGGIDKEKIAPETKLETLDFDSLVLIELSLKLRKEFGVIEVGEELDLLETVDDLFQLVKERQTV
ncbi:acyl carrier protein [Serratia fonticola]|uniref:acyl carrier protein n=1 Tax=Serratia fonticola TaxID=47917 RepID=UPI001AE8E29B|nr:acyl carrier protein [Serratia fonticola]MBP0995649.1 acyl carrier protein [Serratia fonticola]MBP1000933.1 acyl carrier protein [Serratia fonticola]MBP1010510.1 acyl carrier protein [Serratia fonticola]MBP1035093.1 acyl carrier protein [Serratia fonticola]